MTKFRAVHELQVFRDTPKDRLALASALMVFVRNTSHVLRTQTNQIQFKFDHPENNPACTMYYIGLRQNEEMVGFAMLGYFPRRRVVLIDHMVIDAEHRKHGAFFVFASLLRSFIEKHCPNFDCVVAEVAIDREFAEDEVSGQSVVRILRQVGFGEVRVKYSLANTEPEEFRRTYRGALMIRSSQKILALRAEEFLSIYDVILFDNYLGWYRDFSGTSRPTMKPICASSIRACRGRSQTSRLSWSMALKKIKLIRRFREGLHVRLDPSSMSCCSCS